MDEETATLPPEDAEHLRLLGIFHYVLGGLGCLCSFLPVLHLVFGIAILGGHLPTENHPQDAAFGRFIGGAFVAIASVIILGGLTLSGCLIYAGRCLQERRNRTFCLVVAGASCLWTPFGTVLGVFTLIVLSRPAVKASFDN